MSFFDVLLLPFADKPATELPKAEIMSLLKDPSSLVQVRDSISTLQGNKHIRNSFHVVSANVAWLEARPLLQVLVWSYHNTCSV